VLNWKSGFVLVAFWHWAAFKKKLAYTSAVVKGTALVCPVAVYFWTFCAIFQRGFWRTAVVCYTFHHSCTTAFVSSILFIAAESNAVEQPLL